MQDWNSELGIRNYQTRQCFQRFAGPFRFSVAFNWFYPVSLLNPFQDMGLSIPNLVLEIFLKACFIISLLYCRPLLKKDMTVTIISRHSKTIHKVVEEQMKKEVQELGFDPWGDSA